MLVKGFKISHVDEYENVKGWRLAAIIHNLREKYGWPIDNEDEGNKNIRYYYLRKGTDVADLRWPRSYTQYKVKQEVLG